MFVFDAKEDRRNAMMKLISKPLSARAIDADGPTLVGDPDLGFAGLRQFGPTLIHHSQLKNRKSHLNFMLVSFCFGELSKWSNIVILWSD